MVKEKLKDNFLKIFGKFSSIFNGAFNKEKYMVFSLIISLLINKYLFLLYLIYIIFYIYETLIKDNVIAVNRKRHFRILISLFIISISFFLIKCNSNSFIYWIIISIYVNKILLLKFKKIFKKENNFLSLDCLLLYSIINSVIMSLVFKNKFIELCILNTLISISVFFQRRLFNKYKEQLGFNFKKLEYFLLKIVYIFLIPFFIIFIFFNFNIIKFY